MIRTGTASRVSRQGQGFALHSQQEGAAKPRPYLFLRRRFLASGLHLCTGRRPIGTFALHSIDSIPHPYFTHARK